MTIHELLTKRYAVREFDPSKKVSQIDLQYILEAARLSCSSANTQPWKIIVVESPDLRAKLKEVGYGQSKIAESSHLLVIATMRDPMVRVNKTAELIAVAASQESADAYTKMVQGLIRPTPEATLDWLMRQTYLALQAMMLAAMERGIDSCPMEGFMSDKVDEILGLTDAHTTTMLALGYAAKPGHSKIRVPMEDIVEVRA